MAFYAHRTDDGCQQTVMEHLEETAKAAAGFSVPLMQSIAYAAGKAHDIGKYAEAFQKRLRNQNVHFEHALCGAIVYKQEFQKTMHPFVRDILAYCIAGHHTGLPDGGSRSDDPDDSVTLCARMHRADRYVGERDYHAFQKELTLPQPDGEELVKELTNCLAQGKEELYETYAFFTRYLFSCLTDADFLDTELFFQPNVNRSVLAEFPEAVQSVEKCLNSFQAETELQAARGRLQEQAYMAAKNPASISILNMPTGSGKTLCSLKIALDKLMASKGKKKRLIYVIPYTSIIEQTAKTFEKLIGEYVDILQHHSNYDYAEDSEPDTAEKMKRASENWDVPVVVTTTVQFFESFYHNRSSRLRKLHNMADSVIVFDEIHMLPVELLQPCLRAVGYLTRYLNSEAVFLSATMPDYSELFARYLKGCTMQELVSDRSDFCYFQKCRYTFIGEQQWEQVVEKASAYQSSLIIVNHRKSAQEVFRMLEGRHFHLSTFMTPHDRSETISAIRKALVNGEKITVVSTSLIEAGVDLDFEAVFREIAGLDSILQSGGRCNREGRRGMGDVFVFSTKLLLRGEFQRRAELTRGLLAQYKDIASEECIKAYYQRLFDFHEEEIKSRNLAKMQGAFCDRRTGFVSIPFRAFAEEFQMISGETTNVIIPDREEPRELLERLHHGDYSVRRKLQQYAVALKFYELEKAFKMGIVEKTPANVWVLSDPAYYNPETGLDTDISNDIIV